ncbi:3-isopropylmalate dehydratase small subunit [bacterium]|nr:3-isopropylmalate dehydratase small subunit [bacterium]
MEPFVKLTGIAALLNRRNVDTDQIIPKQYLTRIEKTGFGAYLFNDWRFNADGSENTDFELNNNKFRGATILVAGDNFGCGSSREHAPWALLDYGFKVIISTSFADIFFNNCFKNGILLIKVSSEDLSRLMTEISGNEGVKFNVDLANQKISTPGGISLRFEIDAFKKESLLQGLDEISWSLKHQTKIQDFEKAQKASQPWLWE